MPTQAKILAFAGSTRTESYNKRLVRLAAQGAEEAGAVMTVIDLRDFPLPLFDEDLEKQGKPENATKLKALMVGHDGFLISSPEHNSSISAVLKNAIDWASRPVPGEPRLVAYQGKTAALMSASPGELGGLRGLVHLRSILGNIGVLVLPGQVAVSRAFEAFDEAGALRDPKQQAAIKELGTSLTSLIQKLRT